MLGLPWGPRLRGTAALQGREDHWSLDQDLEGLRSLGAVLVDPSFVSLSKAWANVGPSLDSAAARDCSPTSNCQALWRQKEGTEGNFTTETQRAQRTGRNFYLAV